VSKKRPRDVNSLAKQIVDEATGAAEPTPKPEKNMARSKGGKVGGKARADALTPERRREIARKASEARWAKQGRG
jgi:hypothetical protein